MRTGTGVERAGFEPLLTDLPASYPIVQDDAECAILIPLARCRDTDRVVSVETSLGLSDHGGTTFFEFAFAIGVDAMSGGGESFTTQDREVARPSLPAAVRPLVMRIVLRCYSRLLVHVRPDLVYRVTKLRNPPPRALNKHHVLSRVLEYHDYAVIDSGTDPHGRVYWWFRSA